MKTLNVQMQSYASGKPIDIFASKQPVNDFVSLSSGITGVEGGRLDAHIWLPLCAESYNISPNLKDYVVIPVITIISDLPNTNGDSISKQQLLRFDTECGMPMYKTFKGKPTHTEHENKDLLRSKGVIFDAYISPLRGFRGNRAKVVELLGFDRTKDPKLVSEILSGEVNTYSIGARFGSYVCSITGQRHYPNMAPSKYTQPGMPTYSLPDGRLAYRELFDLVGFETSRVRVPAYTSAVSDDMLDLRNVFG